LEPDRSANIVDVTDPGGSIARDPSVPIILWLLGVPLVVVIALMITHVI
jgi:hypothetical protein